MQRALNWLAWLGMAIVFIAAPVRILGWMEVIPVSARLISTRCTHRGPAWPWSWSTRCRAPGRGGRNSRYGMLALVSVGLGLAILVAVNYLSSRQNKRWDLTANQQFTLSEQTIKLLQGLNAPAKFLVFDRARGFERFRARMNSYEALSKKVSVEYVDVDRFPIRAQEYDVDQYGTVVVEYMGRKERVTTDDEQDITNALIKVVNPATNKVYFLAGHGEKVTGPADEQGLSTITDALRRDNYEFDTLVLAQTNAVPADATVIVDRRTAHRPARARAAALEAYLDKGGKLLVLLDPPADLKAADPTPRLVGLLAKWGIKATPSVDRQRQHQRSRWRPRRSVRIRRTRSPIASGCSPCSRSCARYSPKGAGRDGHAAQPFVQTGANSWAETDLAKFDPNALTQPDEAAGDILGPVTIGVTVAVPVKAAEPTPTPAAATAETAKPAPPETRIAAIGDSDFVTNRLAGVPGNLDLFMNTVNWLAQQENLISIRPRDPAERRLSMNNRRW